MKKTTHIQLHRDELKASGMEISLIADLPNKVQIPHRDDHYMFIIQSGGLFLWELDFMKVDLSGSCLFYIAPGQVHRYLQHEKSEGWFVFINTSLISDRFIELFNTYLNSTQVFPLSKTNKLFSFIPVCKSFLEDRSEYFQKQIINSLADTFAGMAASALIHNQRAEKLVGGQKYLTVNKFKQLVQTKYKELKQVKDYAMLLNITPLYLNEIVKQITGFTASYWIQQKILLESQRLLYYTDLDVKQIAFELGFEDHTYFSRFFKKNIGMTASDFRVEKL
jgi:AraC-like DNA-binding protein